LGLEVTGGPWIRDGDFWILDRELPNHKRPFQASPIFCNNIPLFVPNEQSTPCEHRGWVEIGGQAQVRVRFPQGLSPENSRIFATGPSDSSGVHISGRVANVIIRNLTVRLAGNDGFNFHGQVRRILLEGVHALMNGDQGISSHGECQVEARDCEVAFNGSRSGGIVDIGQSKTSYYNLLVHHNRGGGFRLIGSSHRLEGVLSIANEGPQLPPPSKSVVVINSSGWDEMSSQYRPHEPHAHAPLNRVREVLSEVPYPGVIVRFE